MSQKPRLLTICEFYPRDKSDWKGIFIRDYVHSVSSEFDVAVLCTAPRGDQRESITTTDDGIDIHFQCTAERGAGRMTKWRAIRQWYRESAALALTLDRPDIIHVHNSVLQGRLAYKLSKHWGIPLVVSEHTGPFSSISDHPIKRRQARFVMKRADQVYCVSEGTKLDILKAGIKPASIEVSHNPVDTVIFKAGLVGPHKTIAFVSRLDEFKGGLRTVKAFETLLKEFPDYTLKVVGYGEDYEPIRQYVLEQGLGDKVMLFGMLSKKEIYDVLKRSDLLVFPSRHESFGLVAAEAWATGIPVIIGNQVGAADVMSTSRAELGLKVDSEDIASIAAAIRTILNDLERFDREKIRAEIVDKLSPVAFGKFLIERYQRLLPS